MDTMCKDKKVLIILLLLTWCGASMSSVLRGLHLFVSVFLWDSQS